MFGGQIETAVVSTWSPRTVWLGYHVERGRPRRIGSSDNFEVPEFFFCNAEFFRIEAPCLGKNRPYCCFNGMKNAMFRIRGSGSVADNGGEGGKECADSGCHVAERCCESGFVRRNSDPEIGSSVFASKT